MEHIVHLSKCWEKQEVGYSHTHVKFNRLTNQVVNVSYMFSLNMSSDDSKSFETYENLLKYINELASGYTISKS